jgi:Na+/H+ antiporter NhaB
LTCRAALYHFGLKDGAKKSFRRLKPVLYAFDGLLGAAFITLLIVYFSLSDQITITCESDIDVSNFTTPKQIVAIVYKAFFAVVCIILSIAFLVYGSRIIRSSTSFTVKSLDRAEQRAIKKRKRDVLNVSRKVLSSLINLFAVENRDHRGVHAMFARSSGESSSRISNE